MSAPAGPIDIPTPSGLARAHLHTPDTANRAGALVLGHGAGGSIAAPDLVAVTAAARGAGYAVVLVEQPYRVAGKRAAAAAPRLDAAWIAVLEHLRAGLLAGLTVVTGGRSSGARVACRTAAATGAAGVLCLAFPLRPPGSDKTRQDELDGVAVPVLVIQGERDPFGMPPAGRLRTVVPVPGDHGLKRDVAGTGRIAADWLGRESRRGDSNP